ncbi:Transcription factor adf-1-like protein, partial [Temnothorax longispinosus]
TINSLSKSSLSKGSLSKSKRSIDIDTLGSNSSASKKKNKNVQPAESVKEDFESFCIKNIDPTVPDRIGSFILYLESEMRVLSNQAMKKLIRKITESLMQKSIKLCTALFGSTKRTETTHYIDENTLAQ